MFEDFSVGDGADGASSGDLTVLVESVVGGLSEDGESSAGGTGGDGA